MADFNVDLQQPRAAGASVVSPVRGVDYSNMAEAGVDILKGLVEGKKIGDKAKKEAYKNGILNDFAAEQTALNQAMAQGSMSKAEASAKARANYSKYVGSYAEFAQDFTQINKGLFEFSELENVKSEEQLFKEQRKQLFSDMQKDGLNITPDMSPSTVESMVKAFQEGRRAQKEFEFLAQQRSEMRAQSQEERASFNFQVENTVSKNLAILGGTYLTAAQGFSFDIVNAVKGGKDPLIAEQEVNKYFSNIEGGILAIATQRPDLANQWRGLFDTLKKSAMDGIAGKLTADALENQLKTVKNKAQLMALSSPNMQGIHAVSALLNGNLPALYYQQNIEALNVAARIAAGAGSPTETIVGNQGAEKASSALLEKNIKELKAGTHPQPEQAKKELGNIANNILRGVDNLSFSDTPVNPKVLNTVADLLAKPEWAYMVEQGLIDQSANQKAKQAFQVLYQKEVSSGIVDKLKKDFIRPEGQSAGQIVNNTDLVWSGSGVMFQPKQGGYMSSLDRQYMANYQRELNSSSVMLNKLIHIGAHMEGHTDYAKYWEENKHRIIPSLYVPVGTERNGYKYVGPGFATDKNSWKKVEGDSGNFKVGERKPYPSEDRYFKDNPNVAGMAAEDNKVVMNPYSKLSDSEKNAVRLNESARIFMRTNNSPSFSLTPEQEKYLNTTDYKNSSEEDRKQTIAARLLSGDPSAGKATQEQLNYVEKLRKDMGVK